MLQVSNEAQKRQPVIFTPTVEDEGASKSRAKYENNKPVGGMLRRHFWTLEPPEYLDKELDDICIRLLFIRRLGCVNSQDVCQGAGDQQTHVLVLVLQQPVLT